MRVDKLIEELMAYPTDGNARAYEGEVCGIIIERGRYCNDAYEELGVIFAHESEPYNDDKE